MIDGDTFDVRFADGSTDTVRLLGVDTPETGGEVTPGEFEGIPDSPEGRNWLRQWGQKASQFTTQELEGKQIQIAIDETADRRGSYDRLLAYAYVDGTLFNRQLIDQGYARLYDTQFSKRSQFQQAESTAQANDVGLWGFEASEPEANLKIGTVHYNPDGDERNHPEKEYFVLKNTGGQAVNLEGYQVTLGKSDDQHFRLPNFELGPGEQIRIHVGKGSNDASNIYLGYGTAALNNDGDHIQVLDPTGTLVAEKRYQGD